MNFMSRMNEKKHTHTHTHLTAQKSTNEALHEHHLAPQSLDFPAAYASDVPTPATAKGTNESDHSEI